MSSDHNEPEGADEEEMMPEYDFTGGTRGKHYQAYRAGHSVTIHHTDGSSTVQHFKLEDGAVMLDPEVRQYFPDSEAVNKALRGLIALIPEQSVVRSSD